jgi:hypothetical protein
MGLLFKRNARAVVNHTDHGAIARESAGDHADVGTVRAMLDGIMDHIQQCLPDQGSVGIRPDQC